MATLSTALAFARAQTQTDSNGLTDANGIIFANEALLDFHRQLISGGVDASQVREFFQTLPAGTGTFLWPSNMFFLKTLEANFVDGNQNNFVSVGQVDVANLQAGMTFDWMRANQPASSAKFDDRGDWAELFPTPTISVLLRIMAFISPTEFTATSDTIIYPSSLDYRILGWRIAASYLKSLSRTDEAEVYLNDYNKRVKEIISTLGRGEQKPFHSTGLQVTGWEF